MTDDHIKPEPMHVMPRAQWERIQSEAKSEQYKKLSRSLEESRKRHQK